MEGVLKVKGLRFGVRSTRRHAITPARNQSAFERIGESTRALLASECVSTRAISAAAGHTLAPNQSYIYILTYVYIYVHNSIHLYMSTYLVPLPLLDRRRCACRRARSPGHTPTQFENSYFTEM